jgi:hypothetical protein
VVQTARRELVKVLLALASAYSVALALKQDATDAQVSSAFRRVVKAVHPDKGGKVECAQKLHAAKDKWDIAKRTAQKGRPRADRPDGVWATKGKRSVSGDVPGDVVQSRSSHEERRAFRINAPAVLLTFCGIQNLEQWHRFLVNVRGHLKVWSVKHWCATLEGHGEDAMHVHLMLQFARKMDRTTRCFTFEGITPRADANDPLGEGWCRKRMQQSIDRGMFYCWANKIGTQTEEDGTPCVDGNYFPCWTNAKFKYVVLGRWAETLWKARKLEHGTYEEYLFKCRDAVLAKKRNLDACRAQEHDQEEQAEMRSAVMRIRSNPAIFKLFPAVPAAQQWLANFEDDALRYPVLVVLGPSSTGKTEWAKSLFKNALELKVGNLLHFPEGMHEFSRRDHDALVLDDVRDLNFVVQNQEQLQGKYDAQIEFASTPGGTCTFKKWMFKVPTVITVNYSTKNLQHLETNDWLGKPCNRVVIQWPVPGASVPSAGGA